MNNIYTATFRLFFLILLLFVINPAYADMIVITDEQKRGIERFRNTEIVDQTDQFCEGLKRGSSCLMPDEYIDGGNGTCERKMSGDYKIISLACVSQRTFFIQDRMSDTHQNRLPFSEQEFILLSEIPLLDWNTQQYCGSKVDDRIARLENTPSKSEIDVLVKELCSDINMDVIDAYCQNKSGGNTCTVAAQTITGTRSFPGVCQNSIIEYGDARWENRPAILTLSIRNELRCEPLQVEHTYTKVSVGSRLRSVFE